MSYELDFRVKPNMNEVPYIALWERERERERETSNTLKEKHWIENFC